MPCWSYARVHVHAAVCKVGWVGGWVGWVNVRLGWVESFAGVRRVGGWIDRVGGGEAVWVDG